MTSLRVQGVLNIVKCSQGSWLEGFHSKILERFYYCSIISVLTGAAGAITVQLCSKWAGTGVAPGVHCTEQAQVRAFIVLTHIFSCIE